MNLSHSSVDSYWNELEKIAQSEHYGTPQPKQRKKVDWAPAVAGAGGALGASHIAGKLGVGRLGRFGAAVPGALLVGGGYRALRSAFGGGKKRGHEKISWTSSAPGRAITLGSTALGALGGGVVGAADAMPGDRKAHALRGAAMGAAGGAALGHGVSKTLYKAPKEALKVLGLSPKTSKAEIKKAYRSYMRKHHPDLHMAKSDAEIAATAARSVEGSAANKTITNSRWFKKLSSSFLGEMEKISKELNIRTLHKDRTQSGAPAYVLPDRTAMLAFQPDIFDIGEAVAPFNRYHGLREISTRSSNARLLKLLGKMREGTPEQRAYHDELIARGLSSPAKGVAAGEPIEPEDSMAMLLGGMAGGLGMGVLAERMGKSSVPLSEQKGYEQLAQYIKSKGVDLHLEPGVGAHYSSGVGGVLGKVRSGSSAGYIAVDPRDRLSTLAHEAGHATGGTAKKVLQKLYGAGKLYGMYALAPVATGAMIAGADPSFTKDKKEQIEKIERSQKMLAATALPYAPVLAEEGRATARALRMMSKLRGAPGVAGGLANLTPAFGTYLMALAAPAIGAMQLQKRKKRTLKEMAKEQKSERA